MTGKVLWHVAMSLDGFIASADQSMDWLSGVSHRPGLTEESVANLGAILTGRRAYDVGREFAPGKTAEQAYGGAFRGPVFVLTHHPEDAVPEPRLTFLNCDIKEAVRIALDAAAGKDVEIFSADLGRQCIEHDLIDEIWIHLAPVLLGDGVRLYDNPGGAPVRLARIIDGDPAAAVDLRYRPAGTAFQPPTSTDG